MKQFCDLILRSRAEHGVSKDGHESAQRNILRDAAQRAAPQDEVRYFFTPSSGLHGARGAGKHAAAIGFCAAGKSLRWQAANRPSAIGRKAGSSVPTRRRHGRE